MKYFSKSILAGVLALSVAGAQAQTPSQGMQTTTPLVFSMPGDINTIPAGGWLAGIYQKLSAMLVGSSTTVPVSQSGGTVTTGGTFQQVLAANSLRTSCLIQNTSGHTAYVYWLGTGTPSLTNAAQVQAGASLSCINPSGAPIRTAIQWTTGTTGDAFVVTENQ